MIKSTAKNLPFLIFVLLYAPIITLMVLSFNNTKHVPNGTVLQEMVFTAFSKQRHHECALYNTYHRLSFRSDRNFDRNCRRPRHPGNAYKSTYITSRSHKYSDAQRRYCNRNFSHAPFHCMSVYTWIFHNIASTYYI